MAVATLNEWKQFMEGRRRGDVGPYVWSLRTAGTNRWREFHDGPVRRAWMRSIGAAVDDPSANTHATTREYNVHPQDLNATAHIYIPSDQDIEDWGDGINCLADCRVDNEIAAREPVQGRRRKG